MDTGKSTWRHSKKTAIHKPRREASRETNPISSGMLDSSLQRWGIHFCGLTPSLCSSQQLHLIETHMCMSCWFSNMGDMFAPECLWGNGKAVLFLEDTALRTFFKAGRSPSNPQLHPPAYAFNQGSPFAYQRKPDSKRLRTQALELHRCC